MLFAPDTDVSLRAAAALVNTQPDASDSGHDELATTEALRSFFEQWQYTGDRLGTAEELGGVREVRPVLRGLLLADPEAMPALVNRILAEDQAVPQLVTHDELGWHLHATPASAPLAVRIRVETAMALVDLIRRGEVDRIKVCAADDCEALLVDLSKNRSKRFCDVGNCGNRANVNAYRARKAASA
jgi:predicted RNA-binding Zn ribbon-like protein